MKSTSDDDEENLSRLQKAYQEFESLSLRQQVSTAEKLGGFLLRIAGNPRNFAYFALKPDSEKVSYWIQRQALRLFSLEG